MKKRILESVSEIGKKLRRNFKETLKKYRKLILKKTLFDNNFAKFSR